VPTPEEEAFFDRLRLQRESAYQGNEVQILRAFDWISPALTTFRERPLPGSYLPIIRPVMDVFGTSRLREVHYEQVLGGLGNVELLHGPVDSGHYRHYLSIQFSHDDATVISREFAAVRVVTTDGGGLFPSVALSDGVPTPALRLRAERNITAPPLSWVGARAGGLDAASRITLRVLWIEFPLGESFRSIQ
jgi:hypothetical protein